MMRLLFFFLLSMPMVIFGQKNHQIKVLCKYKKNTVLLRWAPTDPFVWQLGVKYGYTIEKFNVLVDGKLNDKLAENGKPLSSAPIKPYSKEAFDELIKTEEMAGVVQEAIYGESFQMNFDSNSPASVLKKNQELENRFGMALFSCDMSPKTAIAAGLMWMDKNTAKGTRYIYRISLAQNPSGVIVEPGVVVMDAGQEKALPAPEKLKIRFSDHQATLSWPILFHRGIYTAYIIERSGDGRTFKPLTDLPYANTSERENPETSYYVDSIPINHKTYHYRIRGISPFGEKGPISSVVSGQAHKSLDGLVLIDSSFTTNNSTITISWTLAKEYTKLIKGFFVERAAHPDGPYKGLHPKILPISQLNFIDIKPKTNNYYRIRYLPKDKDESFFSFPYLAQLMDTIPPSAPLDISGRVDTAGVVNLIWKRNLEEDMLGYRVFRSTDLKEEFVELTNKILTQPLFTDTINIETLTRKVFYKIVAVDNYYNPSDYSVAFPLKRPDIIAPASPVFTQTERKETSIYLGWQPSISNDVSFYDLYRVDKEIDSLTKVKSWLSGELIVQYKETTATLGKRYTYLLVAVDSAGNKGETKSKEVFFETGVRNSVKEIKTQVDRKNKKVVLEWKFDEADLTKVIIYKYKEGEPIKIYRTLSGNENRFEDTDLAVNSIYLYKIKVFLKSGAQSQLSEEIRVRY